MHYERECWEAPDGDFIHVDWAGDPRAINLLVLFHGLEGGSRAPYARKLAALAAERGWRIAVPHFRGCSGRPNHKVRGYHAGDSRELDWILRRFAATLGSPVYAAGVSLGANALLRWLGEHAEDARRVVLRAVAVSAPFDLVVTGGALERGFSRVYAKYFLRHDLRGKALAKLFSFAGAYEAHRVRGAATLREFDDAVTAPVHGFLDVDDYWRRAAARPWLERIRVRTLLLNARNDPFLPEHVLDATVRLQKAGKLPQELTLEFPEEGGHAGFGWRERWLARRVFEFLTAQDGTGR